MARTRVLWCQKAGVRMRGKHEHKQHTQTQQGPDHYHLSLVEYSS